MSRFLPTDQEIVLAAAERFAQSDDPIARLAGQIALLEPTGFDDKGRLVSPRAEWAFAHENLQTGVHVEQGARRLMRVERKPRRFTMDALFGLLEEGNGKATVYSATVSLGFMGATPGYGEVYIDTSDPAGSNISRHSEGAAGAKRLEVAENMVQGISLGILTTDSKFSQLVSSILESSSGVPDEKLGARLDVVARRCLEDGRQDGPWDVM